MDKNSGQHTEYVILDAAEELFLSKGFSLASTTDIAKKVGCNQALIHYYYRTKDKLFEAVFLRKSKVFFSAFFMEGLEELSFEERLRRRLEAHFDALRKNPRVPFLLINELFTNPARFEKHKGAIRRILAKYIKKVQDELDSEAAAGRIRKVDALDFVLCAVSLNIGYFFTLPVYSGLFSPSGEELDRQAEKRKKDNVEFALRFLEL